MTPWLDDGDLRLYHGDCLEVLRALPDKSVHMCATSPPFYGLRDYGTGTWEGGDPDCDHMRPMGGGTGKGTIQGSQLVEERQQAYAGTCRKCGARRVDRQIGLEETPDQWVDRLVQVFREVRRVLRDDGTLWVEIGDSYLANWRGSQKEYTSEERQPQAWQGGQRLAQLPHPTKPKDLLGQPWMLAKALRDPYYTGQIKDERDRVWLAAMLDAEGSIGIHKRPAGTKAYSKFTKQDGTERDYVRKTDSYQPKVEITNTSRAIMDRVVAIAGGNCDTKQEAGTHGRKQTIYRWTVAADKARELLRELYPHLVGKQHEARLAYGCPSSGNGASEAHESLKALHRGDAASIDFAAPETMWEAGWFLRSEIIWARLRPNPMPESVTDRPTKSHSTVFLLSKSPRYYFDQDAIREQYARVWDPKTNGGSMATGRHDAAHIGGSNRHERPYPAPNAPRPVPQFETLDGSAGEAPRGPDGRRVTAVKAGENSEQHRDGERWPNPSGANARSVWTVPTEPTPFAHFATWPQALVRRMILAGTSERGCCPECGAPWVRDVEKGEPVLNAWSANGAAQYEDEAGGMVPRSLEQGSTLKHLVPRETVGWSPSCAHTHQPVPCTVLDPFAGSATTLLVARNHGRHGIGIELNEQYLHIAAQRLQQLSLLTEAQP